MSNIFSLINRAFQKLILGPIRFRTNEGYRSEDYWKDRFRKHGNSIKAVGNEGDSEIANKESYERAARQIADILDKFVKPGAESSVMEIGVGQGFYTKLVRERGVTEYTGVDVTDFYFDTLSAQYNGYHFIKRNAGVDRLEGSYDLVMMIDVIEHIVNRDQMVNLMQNIEAILKPGGHFLITGFGDDEQKKLFYVKHWTISNLKEAFTGMELLLEDKFRKKNVALFRKSG